MRHSQVWVSCVCLCMCGCACVWCIGPVGHVQYREVLTLCGQFIIRTIFLCKKSTPLESVYLEQLIEWYTREWSYSVFYSLLKVSAMLSINYMNISYTNMYLKHLKQRWFYRKEVKTEVNMNYYPLLAFWVCWPLFSLPSGLDNRVKAALNNIFLH